MKIKLKKIYIALITFIICLVLGIKYVMLFVDKDYKVSAYLPIWSDWTSQSIKFDKLTNIYIAFADIDGAGKVGFKNPNIKSEQEILNKIKKLRADYPKIKISLAIGGYKAEGFSDAALTKSSREVFCDSVAKLVQSYNLDGVDIDWEFPGIGPEGGIKSRKEDKENFTLLLSDLKKSLNNIEIKNKKKYELSFAQTVMRYGIENIETEKVNRLVDYINVMSYDYTGVWSNTTGHNANLHKSGGNENQLSTDDSIRSLLKAGFSKRKLILGIPAYGYAWEGVENANNGLYQKSEKAVDFLKEDLSLRGIKTRFAEKNGYKSFWDDKAKSSYLYNGDIFITYESIKSVAFKMDYIKKNGLGGAMIWECSQDNNGELTNYIYDRLRR